MKLQFCNPNIVSFWFQVRAKNNIHNQFKCGASKHTTNILFTISLYLHQGNSKFMLTCDLKNVRGGTMHNAKLFSLKSAIPFVKVKKYISIFCIYVEMLFI